MAFLLGPSRPRQDLARGRRMLPLDQEVALNKNGDQPMKLYLPVILVYKCGDVSRLLPSEFFKRRSAAGNGNILFSDGANKLFDVDAIIDRTGTYFKVEEVTKHANFMCWFSVVWDFVKTESRLLPGEKLTVGELLDRAENWKNVAARMLRKFLSQQDQAALFDEAMFRRAWEHSYVKLPQEDWEKEFNL